MIVTKIYLVVGEKNFPAYTGDSTSCINHYLVPANSVDEVIKTVHERLSDITIVKITLLYEVVEGCGKDENNVWGVIDGIDSDIIYRI